MKWLRRTPEPVGQQSRWLEQLAANDFEIVHRPGIKHGNADALRRIPCGQRVLTKESFVNEVVTDGPDPAFENPRSPIQLAQLQAEDLELREFVSMKLACDGEKPLGQDLLAPVKLPNSCGLCGTTFSS